MASRHTPDSAREPARFFATCPPGLEPVLHREARALGLPRCERQVGGVFFRGEIGDAWRANLHLRTAIRVFWRLRRFVARTADELYKGVSKVDWERFLDPERSFKVVAQSKESQLSHTMSIAQRVKDAVVDQLRERQGKRPDVERDDPDLTLHAHVTRNRVTLSIDTSGESLHKRGWRRYQGRAPLSEVLAAGMIDLSGWDGRSPLVDPFCGSGTILIEAGLRAAGIPPGAFRSFAFEKFRDHDPRAFAALKGDVRGAFPRKLILRGIERRADVVTGARENAASAGLAEAIEFVEGDAVEYEFKRGWNAWIVTNPPYGERLSDPAALEVLFREFGERLRRDGTGYTLAILLSRTSTLRQALGIAFEDALELWNGPILCDLLRTRLE